MTVAPPTSPAAEGLHRGVPFSEYLAWNACSASRLKTLRGSTAAHLQWETEHPKKPTDAMRLGSAIHCALLEPDALERRYRVFRGSPYSKAGKEEKAALRADGFEVLSVSEDSTVSAVADAIRAHHSAGKILDGETEVSAVWTEQVLLGEELYPVTCKARFDCVGAWAGCIVDLKTTKSAEPGSFSRDIYSMGYHLQAAHYLAGAIKLGIDVRAFVILAAEKTPPHQVAVYKLDAEALQIGEDERERLMVQYAQCHKSGKWPGYPDTVQMIGLPPWAWKEQDD